MNAVQLFQKSTQELLPWWKVPNQCLWSYCWHSSCYVQQPSNLIDKVITKSGMILSICWFYGLTITKLINCPCVCMCLLHWGLTHALPLKHPCPLPTALHVQDPQPPRFPEEGGEGYFRQSFSNQPLVSSLQPPNEQCMALLMEKLHIGRICKAGTHHFQMCE